MTKMYTVHDSKAGAYLQPFYARQNGEAIRSFAEACNQKDHNFYKFASDFTLFEIGEFDEQTGVITPMLVPLTLGNGVDYKQSE